MLLWRGVALSPHQPTPGHERGLKGRTDFLANNYWANMDQESKKDPWIVSMVPKKRNKVDTRRGNLSTNPLFRDKTSIPATLKEEEETLHAAIGPIVVMAQCFGLMPLHGVLAPTHTALRFCLRSARSVYCLCIAALMGAVELIAIIHMIKSITSSGNGFMSSIGAATSGAVFYGNACVAAVLFLLLGRRWPSLMATWSRAERDACGRRRPALALRFKVIAGVVLSLALVEHVLSITVNIPDLLYPEKHTVTLCPNEQTQNTTSPKVPERNFLRVYCCSSHPFIFSVVRYEVWIGVAVFVASKVATFIWNYTDIFICLISSALVETFKKLNQRMLINSGKSLKQEEWQELREHYALLSSLTKVVDQNICAIVLLSFANNLYFICLQLLNGLSPNLISIVDSVYFFGSFFFLLARTVMVTMFAAKVNDESQVALPVLYNCPSNSYCIEVSRLQSQITSDMIALTGLRFFYITRNFMLAVTGAIVTYEVVLLQFNVAMLSNKSSEAVTTTSLPPH